MTKTEPIALGATAREIHDREPICDGAGNSLSWDQLSDNAKRKYLALAAQELGA